jgi:hypothetical protein
LYVGHGKARFFALELALHCAIHVETAGVGEAEAVDDDVGEFVGDCLPRVGVRKVRCGFVSGAPLKVPHQLSCFDGDTHSEVLGGVMHLPSSGRHEGAYRSAQLEQRGGGVGWRRFIVHGRQYHGWNGDSVEQKRRALRRALKVHP